MRVYVCVCVCVCVFVLVCVCVCVSLNRKGVGVQARSNKIFRGVTSHRCASVRKREGECERGVGVAATSPGLTVGGVGSSMAHPRVASTPLPPPDT